MVEGHKEQENGDPEVTAEVEVRIADNTPVAAAVDRLPHNRDTVSEEGRIAADTPAAAAQMPDDAGATPGWGRTAAGTASANAQLPGDDNIERVEGRIAAGSPPAAMGS